MTNTMTSPRPAPDTTGAARSLTRPSVADALGIDAVLSGLSGITLTLGANALDGPLGIPRDWLFGIGVFFVVFAASLLAVRATLPTSRPLVWVVAAGNAAWAVLSIVAAIAGWWDPTTAGTVAIVAQALLVDGFAILQYRALTR